MGQPGAGQQSSGQAAMPPDSDDEGDDGSRISCAAASPHPRKSIDDGPIQQVYAADRKVPSYLTSRRILATCA